MPTDNVSLKKLSLIMFHFSADEDYQNSLQLVNMERKSDYGHISTVPANMCINKTSTQKAQRTMQGRNGEI